MAMRHRFSKKAKEAKELADRMAANIEEENRRRREESNRVLSDFGKTKLELLKTCLSPFWATLRLWGIIIRIKNMSLVAR